MVPLIFIGAGVFLGIAPLATLGLYSRWGFGISDPPYYQQLPVKAQMHALQLGLELYAADHHGKYPKGVRTGDFEWRKYIESLSATMEASMEEDVRTTPAGNAPVYTVAQTYTATGRPGTMRYFVNPQTRATYAIIGYRPEDGSVVTNFRTEPILLIFHRYLKEETYVLHN